MAQLLGLRTTPNCVGRAKSALNPFESAHETSIAPVVGLDWVDGSDAAPLHGVSAVAVGGRNGVALACAILKPACAPAGRAVCWGNNGVGELGAGIVSAPATPLRVVVP